MGWNRRTTAQNRGVRTTKLRLLIIVLGIPALAVEDPTVDLLPPWRTVLRRLRIRDTYTATRTPSSTIAPRAATMAPITPALMLSPSLGDDAMICVIGISREVAAS